MRVVTLDVVRFLAASAVVLYHLVSRPESNVIPMLKEITKYGYLGVPLFFMISGYVIALSANNRTAYEFAVSRFVRLYPALWAGGTFTVVTGLLLTERQFTLTQILANFTLLNHYMGFDDLDGVYWTLKAELKFYGCVFLLLVLRVFDKYQVWLGAWLAITVLHAATAQPFFMGWFITPEYSSFFIAGVAFYMLHRDGRSAYLFGILTIALVLSCMKAHGHTSGFIMEAGAFERYVAVGAVLCFFAMFWLIVSGTLRLKERAVYVMAGALTYPIYLIHNAAGKAIIDRYVDVMQEGVVIALVILLLLGVALSIHVFVERPLAAPLKLLLLRKGGRVTDSRRTPLEIQGDRTRIS